MLLLLIFNEEFSSSYSELFLFSLLSLFRLCRFVRVLIFNSSVDSSVFFLIFVGIYVLLEKHQHAKCSFFSLSLSLK